MSAVIQQYTLLCEMVRGRGLHVLSKSRKLVVGAGSNVMDLFYPGYLYITRKGNDKLVRNLPMPGVKEYFDLEQITSGQIVGGVTLNHLSWARALGAPTSLLALQGTDQYGQQIRSKLDELGVSTHNIRVSERYSTSVSHILSEPSGERTIIMAPASTSLMVASKMHQEFSQAIQQACMITTEISQLPLSGVEYLLDSARNMGVLSLLDVDVTPTVAIGSARLGTKEELTRCVTKAKVIKVTASAAEELLSLVSSQPLERNLEHMAQQLADAFKVSMCIVTDGSRGSAFALGRSEGSKGSKVEAVTVPVYSGVNQKDATGAGDAFFGGIVACLYSSPLPDTSDGLYRIGKVAAAAGAACVEVMGALPIPGESPRRVLSLCPDAKALIDAAIELDKEKDQGGGSGASSSSVGQTFLSSLQQDAQATQGLVQAWSKQGGHPSLELVAKLLLGAHARHSQKGHVYTTGIGKSGFVAARLASSLRSVGVMASFIPGGDWWHGDLGSLSATDVLVAISHSGKTVELVDVASRLSSRGVKVVSITSSDSSPLAKASHAHLPAAVQGELLGLVPSRSIIAQEAIVNGLVTAVVEASGLTAREFRDSHPGGAIGSSLDDA